MNIEAEWLDRYGPGYRTQPPPCCSTGTARTKCARLGVREVAVVTGGVGSRRRLHRPTRPPGAQSQPTGSSHPTCPQSRVQGGSSANWSSLCRVVPTRLPTFGRFAFGQLAPPVASPRRETFRRPPRLEMLRSLPCPSPPAHATPAARARAWSSADQADRAQRRAARLGRQRRLRLRLQLGQLFGRYLRRAREAAGTYSIIWVAVHRAGSSRPTSSTSACCSAPAGKATRRPSRPRPGRTARSGQIGWDRLWATFRQSASSPASPKRRR